MTASIQSDVAIVSLTLRLWHVMVEVNFGGCFSCSGIPKRGEKRKKALRKPSVLIAFFTFRVEKLCDARRLAM